jgi:hypothetical protein
VHPRNSKEDAEAIGNRKVGKGPNFYSLEKEIALGKQLRKRLSALRGLSTIRSSPNTSTASDKISCAIRMPACPSRSR